MKLQSITLDNHLKGMQRLAAFNGDLQSVKKLI